MVARAIIRPTALWPRRLAAVRALEGVGGGKVWRCVPFLEEDTRGFAARVGGAAISDLGRLQTSTGT